MKNKIFVGSLPWSVDSAQLKELFEQYGTISDATVVSDRETGRSRGFGFVEFASDEEAAAAVDAMDGATVGERQIAVSIARPKAA